MGQVIPFSKFSSYFEEKQKSDPTLFQGVLLDTNILVTLGYEFSEYYEDIQNFLDDEVYEKGLEYYATVTTKQEFLDFMRRVFMTEHLRDSVDADSTIPLFTEIKSTVRRVSERLRQREKNQGSAPVFSDSDLKEIKQAFSAGPHSGKMGWLYYCEAWLKGKLREEEQNLDVLGIKYLSEKSEHANIIDKPLSWSNALEISERSCLSVSDSMILNMLRASKITMLISNDFDMGYAALAMDGAPDVIMPDKMAAKMKGYHF